MKMKPEHIIISCDIKANGYREITLRLPPIKRGGVFRFYVVEGGKQAHPDLDWKGWEIEGDVFKKGREDYIRITSKRRLVDKEKQEWSRGISKLWREFDYTGEEE